MSKQLSSTPASLTLALNSKAAPDLSASPATPTSPNLTTKQAAEYLNLKPATLEQWRWNGRGPKFCKIGRSCRYRLDALQDFLDERTFASTTEAGAGRVAA